MIDQNHASSDAYANIVDLYDLEHDQFDDDIACFMNFIEAVGDPVLEPRSRHRPVLDSHRGSRIRVTGLDASRADARESRRSNRGNRSRRTRDPRLPFHGRCDQAPGGPFGVVIAPLNGLMHLTTSTEQRSVLAAARMALDPRGQLLLDTDESISRSAARHRPGAHP